MDKTETIQPIEAPRCALAADELAGRIENLGSQLERASTVEEVKAIRGGAKALREMAESISAGLARQNEAAEIKIRAERRIGQELSRLAKNKGGRRAAKSDHGRLAVAPATLKELSIKPMQASRWQAIACVPDNEFESHITEVKARGDELTSVALQRLGRAARRPETWRDMSSPASRHRSPRSRTGGCKEHCCKHCGAKWTDAQ